MAKKLFELHVRGERRGWGFDVLADPRHVEDWRADGLEVNEVCNTGPMWVADYGLARVWCFLQDLFHFKNPFGDG
jgi:hypothetical protein